MNLAFVSRVLGTVVLLMAVAMLFSLPWAMPSWSGTPQFETRGFWALIVAMLVTASVGLALRYLGRNSSADDLFRKEALAIVGLSWILATLLGAMPYLMAGVMRSPIQPMTVFDAIFESSSGFTGAGATVITKLEDPRLVPKCILFWRASTHFLGGLGIMVLFVAVLGQGSAGKLLMRTEMPGPSKETDQSRVQHAAWVFAGIYLGMIAVLTVLLAIEGMSIFDALCHAFGTVATGGFSNYDTSIAHFKSVTIEMTIAVFMVMACVNFSLLYYVVLLKPLRLVGDSEFRVFMAVLFAITGLVIAFGLRAGDFDGFGDAFRYSFFQVASIITNTGFGTHDFNNWNEFGRGLLFLTMFIGGCAGSTSCSIKIIRHMLLFKILWLEIERVFRPHVIRPLTLQGRALDPELRQSVPLYFALMLVIVVFSWAALLMIEPDSNWVKVTHEKLMDCASGVAATINGVGPGLGTLGPTSNYANFSWGSKLIFSLLMLLGRLEIFPLVILLLPRFWKPI